jgi:hypothetical protein
MMQLDELEHKLVVVSSCIRIFGLKIVALPIELSSQRALEGVDKRRMDKML